MEFIFKIYDLKGLQMLKFDGEVFYVNCKFS
jgi:hypothetical protein